MLRIPRILSSSLLNTLIKDAANIRILDCTYNVGPKPNPAEFQERCYGKFEELMKIKKAHKSTYMSAHIPGARHFDLDVGMYPGKYERFSVYEPSVFENYAQLLGINSNEHLVFYGRGPFGGMLFPSRCYQLFKGYGHKDMSLLDGGFEDWLSNGFEVEKFDSDEYPHVERGNFKAEDKLDLHTIKFEEFDKLLDTPEKANLIDSRFRAQFNGEQDTGLDQLKVNGCRIPNTTNVPAAEFLDGSGKLKSLADLQKELFRSVDANKPSIIYCNTGLQASLGATVQEALFPNSSIRLYNGSLKEVEIRAPKRISDGPRDVE